jgi:outer membrane protein OmpA-like peptidoglycan-associated protein/tetratricopeptide (TPR) repeat protein
LLFYYNMKSTLTRLLFLLALSHSLLTFAQPGRTLSSSNTRAVKNYERSTKFFDAKMFQQALDEIDDALKTDPSFIEAYMLKGDILSDMGETKKAITYYQEAIRLNPDYFSGNYFNLGLLFIKIASYEEAAVSFEKYITYPKVPEDKFLKAKSYIKRCRFAAHALLNPVPFDPLNLGDQINTRFAEYLPAVTADEQLLIFTRRQPRINPGQGQSREEEDFYVSLKQKSGQWGPATNLGPPINTGGNEGAQCLSPDGKYLFFTACNRPDGLGSCDLYVAIREGDNWSKPQNLGSRVNSNGWDSQPSVSFDNKTLYFISSRKGGQGKLDMWKSEKQTNGSWGEPVNMGDKLNTAGNEYSPFIHSDNRTLYFASDGHTGMGGIDIFYSRLQDDGTWGTPINIGYPINTQADENSLVVSASGKLGFFASDRLQGKGNLDLYSFEIYPEARPVAVSFVRGKVKDGLTGRGIEAAFEIIDVKTGLPILNGTSDNKNGEYLICLPAGNDYMFNVSKTGYLYYSEHFALKGSFSQQKAFMLDIELNPVKAGNSVVMRNVFFETDKSEVKEESKPELQKLLRLMSENPQMKIEIGGHTDNVGESKYNQTLSERRAKAVYDYLIKQNVLAARISYKGFGDTKPMNTNETEEGRSKNRRTEFKVISN